MCKGQWYLVETTHSLYGREQWRKCRCCNRMQFIKNLTYDHTPDGKVDSRRLGKF